MEQSELNRANHVQHIVDIYKKKHLGEVVEMPHPINAGETCKVYENTVRPYTDGNGKQHFNFIDGKEIEKDFWEKNLTNIRKSVTRSMPNNAISHQELLERHMDAQNSMMKELVMEKRIDTRKENKAKKLAEKEAEKIEVIKPEKDD